MTTTTSPQTHAPGAQMPDAHVPEPVAIVGAGLIGRGWAIVFARAGHDVTIWDPGEGALDAAMAGIRTSLDDLAGFGLIDAVDPVLSRIRTVASLAEALDGAAYVQESGPELLDVKTRTFAEMDALAAPGTILASSSSAIRASLFAEDLAGRARVLVNHPVNPPYLVPLVELSPAPFTDPAIVDRVRELMLRVGQKPILVAREIQGFILNRLQGALVNEAFRLAEDGYASPQDIDAAVSHGLGLRWSFMGPFETGDLNAPAGIPDFIARYGPLFNEMAHSQCDPREWTAELTAFLDGARRAAVPAEEIGARREWRDRRLMAIIAHKREAARTIGE